MFSKINKAILLKCHSVFPLQYHIQYFNFSCKYEINKCRVKLPLETSVGPAIQQCDKHFVLAPFYVSLCCECLHMHVYFKQE